MVLETPTPIQAVLDTSSAQPLQAVLDTSLARPLHAIVDSLHATAHAEQTARSVALESRASNVPQLTAHNSTVRLDSSSGATPCSAPTTHHQPRVTTLTPSQTAASLLSGLQPGQRVLVSFSNPSSQMIGTLCGTVVQPFDPTSGTMKLLTHTRDNQAVLATIPGGPDMYIDHVRLVREFTGIHAPSTSSRSDEAHTTERKRARSEGTNPTDSSGADVSSSVDSSSSGDHPHPPASAS